ncbi:MAG: leucyl aminopeptidase [Candidatus Omnitrophica bacterium]|nr:leucyl aminopeptidase [Candidatus Omnitrophota bacterium]
MVSFYDKPRFDKQAAVVLLTKDQVQKKACPFPLKPVCEALQAAVDASQFEGGKGEMFPAVIAGKVVILVGLGKSADVSLTSVRIVLRRAFLSNPLKKLSTVEVILHEDHADIAHAAVEAAIIGTYAWKKYITRKKDDQTVDVKSYYIVTRFTKEASLAAVIADGVNFSRDLVNDNADTVTPEFLEKTVRDLIKNNKTVSLEVLGRKELSAKGLGLLLAVNQGSNKKPRVVIAKYTGAGKGSPFTAFVGKGLTFDCGGLNLKPSGSIETMREDMSGAAAVIGTLKTVLALKPKKNLIFAFGAVENAIDANSYKPGDVFKGYSGKTVEIGNTDAEGRLVLADVLSYVIKNYSPAKVIDLATLTGACVVALGHDYAGVLGNNDDLIMKILASAHATDDRAWQLPMYPEYKDAIKSKIADIKNISNVRGAAGTVCGAEFLHQFVGETPWVHLDIAGTAFVDGDSHWYYGHGATGYGVRLCTNYLLNN